MNDASQGHLPWPHVAPAHRSMPAPGVLSIALRNTGRSATACWPSASMVSIQAAFFFRDKVRKPLCQDSAFAFICTMGDVRNVEFAAYLAGAVSRAVVRHANLRTGDCGKQFGKKMPSDCAALYAGIRTKTLGGQVADCSVMGRTPFATVG